MNYNHKSRSRIKCRLERINIFCR
ncbi:hypothetical protein ACFW04_008407 [Cataglyphis niger]